LRSENRMSWISTSYYYWQHITLSVIAILLNIFAYQTSIITIDSWMFVCVATLLSSIITVVAYTINVNALKKNAQLFMTQILSSMMLRLMLNLISVIIVILVWRSYANVYVLSLLFSYIVFTALELRTLLVILNQDKKS